MRFNRLVSACGVVACGLAVALAQAPKPADPPPPKPANAVPGTFRAYIALDQRTAPPKDPKEPADPKAPKEPKLTEGKRNVTGFQHDLIVANELNPTVAVFSRSAKPDDATAKLVGKLKELAATYKTIDFGAYLFFPVLDKVYADDAKSKATADELKKWGEGVPVGPVVIGLSEKDSAQTKAWNVHDTGVTVVFYNRLRVVKRWDLPPGGVTDEVIAELAAEVNKELKK